jgi:hypothetical protein
MWRKLCCSAHTWKGSTNHTWSLQDLQNWGSLYGTSNVSTVACMFVSVRNLCCFGKDGCDSGGGPHVGYQQKKDHHFASMDLVCHQWSQCQQKCRCLCHKRIEQVQLFKGIFGNIKRDELTAGLRHEVVCGKSKWCGRRQ